MWRKSGLNLEWNGPVWNFSMKTIEAAERIVFGIWESLEIIHYALEYHVNT